MRHYPYCLNRLLSLYIINNFDFGIFYLVHTLIYGRSVVGWASLMVSIYFLSGIIIATLGIIGVYMGKIFDETKKRPLYLVSKKTDNVTDIRDGP